MVRRRQLPGRFLAEKTMSEITPAKSNPITIAPARTRRSLLRGSRALGLAMIAPATILIVLFFLVPVVMTAVFAFTSMSTATGISGGAYQIAPGSLNSIKGRFPALAERLAAPRYVVDEQGLQALATANADGGLLEDLRTDLLGKVYDDRRTLERDLKSLPAHPSTRQIKQISALLNRAVVNLRFASLGELEAALDRFGYDLTAEERAAFAEVSY